MLFCFRISKSVFANQLFDFTAFENLCIGLIRFTFDSVFPAHHPMAATLIREFEKLSSLFRSIVFTGKNFTVFGTLFWMRRFSIGPIRDYNQEWSTWLRCVGSSERLAHIDEDLSYVLRLMVFFLYLSILHPHTKNSTSKNNDFLKNCCHQCTGDRNFLDFQIVFHGADNCSWW